MDIQQQVSLRSCNTLALDQCADYFVCVETVAELEQAWAFAREQGIPVRVIGDGSNLVLSDDYRGLIIQNNLRGIELNEASGEEQDDKVIIKVAAGENWHNFVAHCLQQHWYGLENLALIPGRVGAAPIQNIGAYGVEIQQFVESVEAFDTELSKLVILDNSACGFTYRDSLFKQQPGRYLITALNLRLSKRANINLSYQILADYFQGQDADNVTPQQVFAAVVEIRQQRLPNPAEQPNAGSFFKNPIVTAGHYQTLKEKYPDLVAYEFGDNYKLAAGWLIDRAGWKGYREGDVGVFERQALVLMNHGNAKGADILQLAEKIAADVREKFSVELEIEPTIL